MCAYLVSTFPGADFLRHSHFVDMKIRTRLLAALADDPGASVLTDARAALWAAGHLGTLPLGLELLIDYDVLSSVVKLATRSHRWSLRGTAIYCLALIGSNPLAAESLLELGWDVSLRSGSCPHDCDGSAHERVLAPWLGEGSSATAVTCHSEVAEENMVHTWTLTPDENDVFDNDPHGCFGVRHRQALAELKVLHNTVVQKKAVKALSELRQQNSATFLSVRLWWYAQRCIAGRCRYPLPVRRFIQGLVSEALSSAEGLELLDMLPA